MKSAQEYQRKVEECKQRAYSAVHPDDKAGWIQLAQGWQDLARWAEKSAEQCDLAASDIAASDIRGPVVGPEAKHPSGEENGGSEGALTFARVIALGLVVPRESGT